METLTVKQPIHDNGLYDDFVYLKYRKNVSLPILNGFNISRENDWNRDEDEHVQLQQFAKLLQSQLVDINLNDNSSLKSCLDHTNRKLCLANNYPIPEMKPIQTIEDLPTLNQIINNHFRLYFKSEWVEDIWLFTVLCKFKPLLIRSDGLSVVSILSLKTDEVVCEPPNHEIPGLQLKSRPFYSEKCSPYLPICLMDISKYELYDSSFVPNDDYENFIPHRWNWLNSPNFNESRVTFKHDINTDYAQWGQPVNLFIDGTCYC